METYTSKYFDHLPHPFNAERQVILDKHNTSILSDPAHLQRDKLAGQLVEINRKFERAVGGIEKVKDYYNKVEKENQLLEQRIEQVKNSNEIGISPFVAATSPHFNLIADALSTKQELESRCLAPIESFTSAIEERFDEMFHRFVDYSSELNANPVLTEEVARLTDLVTQKKQQIDAYKQEQEQEQQSFTRQERQEAERQHSIADADLEGLNLTLGCKASFSRGPVKIGLGPIITLGQGVSPGLGFSLDLDIGQSNTNSTSGVDLSLLTNKGSFEAGVESNFSSSGVEYGLTAQINNLGSLSGGLSVKSKSLAKLVEPATAIENGQVFVGRTVKRGYLRGKSRFGILPVKKLKNFVSSDSDKAEFAPSPLYFIGESDENLSSNQTAQEAQDLEFFFKEEESLTEVEQEKGRSTDQRTNLQQGYILAPTPTVSVQSARARPGLEFYLFGGLLLLWIMGKIYSALNPDQNKKKDV